MPSFRQIVLFSLIFTSIGCICQGLKYIESFIPPSPQDEYYDFGVGTDFIHGVALISIGVIGLFISLFRILQICRNRYVIHHI